MNPWLIAALLGLGWHTGAREVKRFEHLAATEIRAQLTGPEAHVDVKTQLNGIIGGALGDLKKVTIRASDFSTQGLPLYTEPSRPKSGRVEQLELVLDRFELSGLRVDHLEATIPECRFDYRLALREHKIRLSASGVGVGTVRIRQEDLGRYIVQKFREIDSAEVRIENDKVFVEGTGTFLVVKTRFLVIATLEAVDGVRLNLANARIFFDDRRADPASAKVLLDTLNPVVDLGTGLGLLDAVYVRRIGLRGGVMEASGDTRIPAKT